MSENHEDMGQWIQDMTTRSVQEQMRSLQRYQELIRRVFSGELDEQTIREEYMQFAREETTRYARNLASLSLSYYNALNDLNRSFNDRFFTRVMKPSESYDSPTDESPPQRVEMTLSAPVGEEVKAAFVIENKRTETADISFIVSEFAGPAETAPFRPPLQIKPPRFTLAPNEERTVNIQLPLLPELFLPDQHYSAVIIVSGYDDLELHLSVQPTAVKAAVTARPAPAKKAVAEGEDDLTAIAGIGPTFADKLKSAGIQTYRQLAEVDNAFLEETLGKTAVSRAKSGKWQQQARKAAKAQKA